MEANLISTQSSEMVWSLTHRYVMGVNAMQQHSTKAIRNVQTELESILIESCVIPVTRNQTEYDNSYVCSPYTAYIRYARDELGLLNNRGLQWFFKGVIHVADGLLQLGKINQTVSINNWMFSTNPVPSWQESTVQEMTQKLVYANPQHSLSIRSLNWETNAELLQHLQANDWILLPARQVYLFPADDPSWWKRNNVKNDQRLLRKTQLTLLEPNQHRSADFIEIERCFNQLFIEKHSAYNPQFTAEYFEFLHLHRLVEFFSFRDESGRIVASIGLFTQHDIITAPIVGYDTQLPKSLGLYRLLMAVLLKQTHERKQTLNLSSGAGHFKRQRGGTPVIEYTALYVKHLPCSQRFIQTMFAKLLNRYAPGLLQKHEL
ncbi:GNAT family N-acetyltransferase [Thiomicrorhabdus sp.]|uniref:GNAT family N-acetyltransferase n=1 Tax=Thiomicrorhabdus sp. TaxID=2039724 RepID=UPI00356646E4